VGVCSEEGTRAPSRREDPGEPRPVSSRRQAKPSPAFAASALLHEIPGAGVAPSVVRAGQSVPRGRKCQARV
jgi:hypothetical protein